MIGQLLCARWRGCILESRWLGNGGRGSAKHVLLRGRRSEGERERRLEGHPERHNPFLSLQPQGVVPSLEHWPGRTSIQTQFSKWEPNHNPQSTKAPAPPHLLTRAEIRSWCTTGGDTPHTKDQKNKIPLPCTGYAEQLSSKVLQAAFTRDKPFQVPTVQTRAEGKLQHVNGDRGFSWLSLCPGFLPATTVESRAVES